MLKLLMAFLATISILSAVPTGSLEAAAAPIVELTEPVCFTGTEGQDIPIEPGNYSLHLGDGKQLRLILVGDARQPVSQDLEAVTAVHDLDIAETVGLAVRSHEDEYHPILATPEKQVYEAVGFAGKVRPRAIIQPLTSLQLQQLLTQQASGRPGTTGVVK